MKRINKNFDESDIADIEALLREGKISEVQDRLDILKKNNLSRVHGLKIASIARRTGDISYAFKLLTPFVRPEKGLLVSTNRDELLEYASLLTQVGALEEALSIFSQTCSEDKPESFLAYSTALALECDYEEVVPLLKAFLDSPQTNDELRIDGLVRLCTAYCFLGRYEEVEDILMPISEKLRSDANSILLPTVLELIAQAYLFQLRFDKAKLVLEEAWSYVKDFEQQRRLPLEKWLAVLDLYENNSSLRIQEVRRKAVDNKCWEMVRDCDFFESLVTKNEKLFSYVYVGTRSKGYRSRMERFWPDRKSMPEKYDWIRFYDQREQRSVFDLTNFSQANAFRENIRLRALGILSSDFYSLFDVGTLFSALHPKDFYNHSTSPKKVQDTIRRLRDFLATDKIPIQVVSVGESYRLFFEGPCALRVWVNPHDPLNSEEGQMIRFLEGKFLGETFSAKEVADVCSLPVRTVQRKLKSLLDAGLLEKLAPSNGSLYRIKKQVVA